MINNNTPLVSIIIPYYNTAEFLVRTVESIQNQSYTNWEMLLVDDGSSDNGPFLIEKLCLIDDRIMSLKRPSEGFKSGGRGAKNFGFLKSKGQYVVFFDSDDYMLSDYLSERISAIQKNESIDVVFSNFGWKVPSNLIPKMIYSFHDDFNNQFNQVRHTVSFWKSYADLNLFWVPSNMLWKRSSIENLRWNEATTIGEDFEFHSQAISINLNFYCLHKTTWYYMRNANSMMATSENPTQIEKRSLFMFIVLSSLLQNKFVNDTDELIRHFLKDQYRFIRRIIATDASFFQKIEFIKIIYGRIKGIKENIINPKLKKQVKTDLNKSYWVVFFCLFVKKGFGLFEKLIIGKRKHYDVLRSSFVSVKDKL